MFMRGDYLLVTGLASPNNASLLRPFVTSLLAAQVVTPSKENEEEANAYRY
jgi:hypothetical protein